MVKPLVPIPDGVVDFTKRIRNVSVRYLNNQKPTGKDLDKWIVIPLYQEGQDMPLDDDGKTALLVANVNTMHSLLMAYEKRMKQDEEEEKGKGRKHEEGGEENRKRRENGDGERKTKRMKEDTAEKKQLESPITTADELTSDRMSIREETSKKSE